MPLEKEEKIEKKSKKKVEVLEFDYESIDWNEVVYGNALPQEEFPKNRLFYYIDCLLNPIKNIKTEDKNKQSRKTPLIPHVSKWYTKVNFIKVLKI